jgi:hypothetical protein
MRAPSALLIALYLTGSSLTIGAIQPADASPIALEGMLIGSAAPLAPNFHTTKAEQNSPQAHSTMAAHVTRAAINSMQLGQISFGEYYVDWSQWMSTVGQQWAASFERDRKAHKIRCQRNAIVEFTCRSDGTVTGIYVQQSSGDPLCDTLQASSLISSGKLPAFPQGTRAANISFLYVWQYDRQLRKHVEPHAVSDAARTETVSISGQQL